MKVTVRLVGSKTIIILTVDNYRWDGGQGKRERWEEKQTGELMERKIDKKEKGTPCPPLIDDKEPC